MFATLDHANPCARLFRALLAHNICLGGVPVAAHPASNAVLGGFLLDIINHPPEQFLENLGIASLHLILLQIVSRPSSQDTCHQSVLTLATLVC